MNRQPVTATHMISKRPKHREQMELDSQHFFANHRVRQGFAHVLIGVFQENDEFAGLINDS